MNSQVQPCKTTSWVSAAEYRQRLAVPFAFPVRFTTNAFHPDNGTLRSVLSPTDAGSAKRILVFVDDGVAKSWPDLSSAVRRYFEPIPHHDVVGPITPIRGGDASKEGLGVVETVGRLASTYRVDRQSYILVIGGGAVLDAVGLGAALVHRGVRLIRMPTTVLGQNDAGVGVKNGVNAYGQKNFFGCFAPPYAVINDSSFLTRLSPRDWCAGIAEAIKVASIKDLEFLSWIEDHADSLASRDTNTLQELIRVCAGLHLDHIREHGDPFEFGSARPLDFGHWAAHWLEIASSGRLSHGEAVAIGVAIDSAYASLAGYIEAEEAVRILRLLRQLALPTYDVLLADQDDNGRFCVMEGLLHFREHLGGQLTVTFPSPLGDRIEVHEIDSDLMSKAIQSLPRSESEC